MKVNILETQINFGTDGIRGNAENFPFTEEALTRLGTSIAIWANQKFQQPNALIISDPRISSYRITTTLSKALQSNGINIFNGGVLPTPAVSLLITKRFNFGIMISASHNPYEDNGIKLFDGNNGKLSKNDELLIQKYFSECKPLSTTHTQQSWNDAFSIYKTTIISKFQPNFLKDLRIVLDCANGATSKIAPEIFNSLGAKVIVIANQPNGKNINEDCGTLYPQNLKNAVLNNNADIGFAFDGDGDRVIAINKNGIIKDGDDLLAILIKHPSFCNIKTVVGTIMTNYGFELYLNSQNKSLIRTNVGDKYISTKLEEANLQIGGETSGHIIIKDYLPTGDGIFIALKTLESVIYTQNFELTSFEKQPQVLINIKVNKKEDLTQQPYASLIENYKTKMKNGRIVVRYSGTENLLRIMIEAETSEIANLIAISLANELQVALN